MSFVVGREEGRPEERPTGRLGSYRAVDGSPGAELHLDLDGPHAMLVVGKRGYGKSYTLGVIAEEIARTPPLAPVVIDPMGVFDTLAADTTGEAVPARVVDAPTVDPNSLDPRSWCALVGLDPEGGPGTLVWQAAQETDSLAAMRRAVDTADAPGREGRAADNHLGLADSWGVFDTDGLDAAALGSGAVTVLDLSGLAAAPMNAVVRGVGEALYRARVTGDLDRLPWLLVDEAHTFFDGVAARTLERLLTRGRAPGVSLALATQRPSAIPAVGISQADLLCAHRLTSRADIEALRAAQPTYMDGSLVERMPTAPGEVLVVDDATETVHAARIRHRATPHGGDSPRASDCPLAEEPS
jgi:hypothetical protein